MIDANGTSGKYDPKIFEATPDFTPLHDLFYFAKLPKVDFNTTSFDESNSDNATNLDIPSADKDTQGKDLGFAIAQVSPSLPVPVEAVEVPSNNAPTLDALPEGNLDNVAHALKPTTEATTAPVIELEPDFETESETEPDDNDETDKRDEDKTGNGKRLGTSTILSVLLRLLEHSQRFRSPCTVSCFPVAFVILLSTFAS